jgi:hypothetical protein
MGHEDKYSPCDYCGSRRHHVSSCPNKSGDACLKLLFKLLWKLKILIFLGIVAWLGYRWISLGESPMDIWDRIQEWFESA